MNLSEAFRASWKHLVRDQQPILLAVSGGLDSMVMAELFLDAAVRFAVLHCNFRLRGAESDGDEAFVAAWCATNNVPFFSTHFNTQEEAAAAGESIQEAARRLRYKWFEDIRSAHGYAAICTAHHADDNAETVLINLFRGSGIAGLHGIPERNGLILRPVLFATRQMLAAFACEQQISHREDSSNLKEDYLRNAIRHRVMPVAETLLPGVASRMLETSRRIAEAEMLYGKAIERELNGLLEKRGADYYIPVKKLRHRMPLNTICYELFRPFGFTSQQLPFITNDLLHAESGRYLSSPTHRIIRNRDFLIVTERKTDYTDIILVEDFNKVVQTANGAFRFTAINAVPAELDADAQIGWINAAKLESPIILRRWKTGDYFYPLGMGMKKKKLSRFLIDQKLALHDKEKVWVLESNKRIVWVAGMRLDERFKVTAATKSVLKVKFTRG